MDIILIIFFTFIVFCMGYILCKPFFNKRVVNEPTNEVSYLEIKYQMLLLEIKRIINDYQAGALPKEECQTQLRKMKTEADNLLSLTDLDPTELQNIFSHDDVVALLAEDIAVETEKYCPQCGEQIDTNDKFCVHCGHNLGQ